jgi:ribonuclease PH
MRPSGRARDEMRYVILEPNISKYAEGSCMACFGDTQVLCTASVEDRVPPFLRNTGAGWVTAEYGMLPRSTNTRTDREAARGRQSGRTQEIQRLIGRSLRAVTDLKGFGERQVRIDCDVIQADGGTRTAAITGAYVALYRAFEQMVSAGLIERIPLTGAVAAVSCGLYEGEVVLDLDYAEDSEAEADANFVLTDEGLIIEVQGTAEARPFAAEQFLAMMELARQGVVVLAAQQRKALGLE